MPNTQAGDDAVDFLAQHRDGDSRAFRRLVEKFEARLVQFYYRLCWDRDRAEDLTQELFLKLLRGARRYQNQGRLSTYVFRVATNLWIDEYRARRPQPRLYSIDQAADDVQPISIEAAGEDAHPVENAIADEEKEQLRQALQRLNEPHRLVFELAVFQQLPYAEIGQVLEIPVGTVKSRMHTTVAALRSMLGPPDHDTGGSIPFGSAQ